MRRVDAKQQLGALTLATSITFSILWGLSSYAYAKPAAGFTSTAKQMVQLRACS